MSGTKTDLEFEAIRTCLNALEPLDAQQRGFVLNMVNSRLDGSTAPQTPGHDAASHMGSGDKNMRPRDFLRLKKPTTDVERITVLAYYLTHNRNLPHFKTVDLTKLNTEAGGDKFSNAAFTANNAVKQNRYLVSAGSGKKQISTLGEDIVDALPDREALKSVLAATPRRKRTGGRPKAKKA